MRKLIKWFKSKHKAEEPKYACGGYVVNIADVVGKDNIPKLFANKFAGYSMGYELKVDRSEVKSELSWDDWALQLAQHWSKRSKDPSTKVGAVIIGKDRRNVVGGYNGLPSGIPDLPEYLNDRSQKYPLIIHAERNALDNAQFDVSGGTIYVTRHPCSECAKSIVNKRIRRVVYEINTDYESRVADDIKLAQRTFALAGVVLEGRNV